MLNWTLTYPMCPSAATFSWLTPVTCGAARNGASACVTRFWIPGAVICSSDRMARVSVSPDWAAKCSLSSACPGSLPVKLLSAAAPNCSHSVIRHATPAIHITTVSQRCR